MAYFQSIKAKTPQMTLPCCDFLPNQYTLFVLKYIYKNT